MPTNLTVTVTDRTLTRRLVLADVTLEVISYSFASISGPKQCKIKALGTEQALRNLFNALRGEVQILDSGGEAVWWGCLWSVTINNGAIKHGRTLDGMSTSINIVYLLQSINQTYSGAGSQATTGFSTDTAAAAEYGTIQKRIRGSNGSALAATARQSRELSNRKQPQRMLGTADGGEVYAEIVCKGWFDTLDWKYYTNSSGNAAGIEENAVITSEVAQVMGRQHPASEYITLVSNNRLTQSPAYWSLALGDYVYFTSAGAGSNIAWRITVVNGAGGDYTVTPTTVPNAGPGGGIITIDIGTKIYQTFTVTTAFSAAAIDIRCRKKNSPTDNITVKLYTDSGATPNVLQATGTITNTEVASYMSWATAVLDSVIALAPGTYGIEISRSGSSSLNCFDIGVDTGLNYSGGVLKLYAGTTLGWLARNGNGGVNADLIFRVAGVVETTSQINSAVTGAGEFVATTIIENTAGLLTVPYQDGTLTVKQVVNNLLEYGTSSGYRLLAKVNIDRKLVIYQEADYNTSADVLLNTDGIPRRVDGSIIPSYKCPYAVWVRFEPLEFLGNAEKYIFIEEAEYDARTDRWRIVRVKDRASELDLTRLKQ